MASQRSSTIGIVIALVILIGVLMANYNAVERYHSRDAMNRMMQGGDVPPTLALVTFAVGPMRGLIADALWWRAIQMQDKGEFFEAIQLAEWITTLQPTFATVWAYHGWNMSANIVNSVRDPDERWKWVLQGIELLRDEGLRYNPGNEDIRNELASIFQFRIGGSLDPHNDHYKRQWVRHVMRFLQDGTTEEIKTLITAPKDRRELLAKPGVQALVDLAHAQGVDLLTFPGFYEQRRWSPTAYTAIITDAHQNALYQIWLYHSRRGVIESLGMDPERMLLIDTHYGPLDWRLWHAQTIYWAAPDGLPGHQESTYGASKYGNTFIQQAMFSSFRNGRLVFLRDDILLLSNNLEIMGNVDSFLHEVIDQYPEGEVPPGPLALFASFHETAAVIAYTYMEEELAHEMYEAYREMFMGEEEKQRSTFENFIDSRAELMLQERNRDAPGLVLSSMYQAYTWLALGNTWKAQAYERLARFIHRRHQMKYVDKPDAQMPSMEFYQKAALQMAINPAESTLPEPVRMRLGALMLADDSPEGVLRIEPVGNKPNFNMPENAHRHH